MGNDDTSAPLGTISRPYRLHWPAERYRNAEETLGFAFDASDIERAKRRDKRLGVRKYRPANEEAAELGVPANSYVACYLIRDGIHDQSYYNMKNLGKPTAEPKHRISAAARKTRKTFFSINSSHRRSSRATTVKEVSNLVTEAA